MYVRCEKDLQGAYHAAVSVAITAAFWLPFNTQFSKRLWGHKYSVLNAPEMPDMPRCVYLWHSYACWKLWSPQASIPSSNPEVSSSPRKKRKKKRNDYSETKKITCGSALWYIVLNIDSFISRDVEGCESPGNFCCHYFKVQRDAAMRRDRVPCNICMPLPSHCVATWQLVHPLWEGRRPIPGSYNSSVSTLVTLQLFFIAIPPFLEVWKA